MPTFIVFSRCRYLLLTVHRLSFSFHCLIIKQQCQKVSVVIQLQLCSQHYKWTEQLTLTVVCVCIDKLASWENNFTICISGQRSSLQKFESALGRKMYCKNQQKCVWVQKYISQSKKHPIKTFIKLTNHHECCWEVATISKVHRLAVHRQMKSVEKLCENQKIKKALVKQPNITCHWQLWLV